MELKPVYPCIAFRRRHAFNRTLWNWNWWRCAGGSRRHSFNRTLWNWNLSCRPHFRPHSYLLIVPYGIETMSRSAAEQLACLLIVPYGIETWQKRLAHILVLTFNRTLWNWNRCTCSGLTTCKTFNRTLWNWNYRTKEPKRGYCGF